MGSAKPLHLFVIVFAFIYLVNFRSDALPSTSDEGEVHETKGFSTPSSVLINNELIKAQKLRIGRIEYEINDYPGSGANGRHSP